VSWAVRIDTGAPGDLSTVAAAVRQQEQSGYDGTWVAETSRDPFLPLAIAAEHSSRIELGTSIAVAFARSPMTLANTANDLQQYSQGRFLLGLGSQIKPHIEKRFSMPWSHPAARMREFVLAMRAIWDCWNNRTKLDFRGEFYTHTLMTPFFDPGPNPYGPPKVYLAGVGELMTEVAGETCDGFIAHGFTTADYLRNVTIPALERGLAKSGRTRSQLDVSYPVFIVTGRNDQEFEAAAVGTRKQIAFYGSTRCPSAANGTRWERSSPTTSSMRSPSSRRRRSCRRCCASVWTGSLIGSVSTCRTRPSRANSKRS
jgi:probable F420-dependent oxidoreductase